MYQALEPLLVRAALHPTRDLPGTWPDIAGDTAALRDWLAAVWASEVVADAVELASPSLTRQVQRVLSGAVDPGDVRGVVESVARYLLRMTGRATPFGLFAGVAPAATGPIPAARWGTRHRIRCQPDGAWLETVIAGLEASPMLLLRVPVVVNDLAQVRRDRVVLAFQPNSDHADQRTDRDAPPSMVDVSLRRTAVLDAVLRYARTPILVGDLLDKLRNEFPAHRNAAAAVVGRLVALRLLLTPLRPPTTASDPVAHVLDQLERVDADALPDAAEHLHQLRARDRDEPPAAQSQAVDVRLDAHIVLPKSLARRAAQTGAVLTRLSPTPTGAPAWIDHHAAFLERYGIGAVVPLAEVIDPRTGLGFPATFRSSTRTITAAAISSRDRALLRLAQTATSDGGDEIVLDDRLVEQITDPPTGDPAGRLRVPPHVEVTLQIHAEDVAAMHADRYRLLVRGGSRAAGTTTGRFLGMLDESDLARFRDAYATLATVRSGAAAVQLSQPPLRAASAHLAATPRLLPDVLSIGEVTDQTGALRAGDLAVSADINGMWLVHLPDGRIVEPTVFNAVEFRYFSHPLARYLCELPRTGTAVYMPFTWGAAASLAHLPRVRFGRTVLAPRRWNLTATDLPAAGSSWTVWQDGLEAWRHRFRMPDHIHLVDADNLLPLDLTVDMHRRLLRNSLDRSGHARLEERPSPKDFGWLGGHVHEITVALNATATGDLDLSAAGDELSPRTVAIHGGRTVSVKEGDQLPAHVPGTGTWVSAKLYTAPDAMTELVRRVPALLTGWDDALDWWHLPYQDPQPHLRLRVRLADRAAWGEAITRVGTWAGDLHHRGFHSGLVLDTYRPETGRYGHGEAMAAAERVFAADSVAAMAEQAAAHASVPLEAIAAASSVDILAAAQASTASAMCWAVAHLPQESGLIPRSLHTVAVRVADPTDEWNALRQAGTQLSGRSDIAAVLAAWRRRGAALSEYRDVLAGQRDPESVLPALLHLHAVRLFGIDPDRERRTRRLTRAAALRWIALHDTSQQRTAASSTQTRRMG